VIIKWETPFFAEGFEYQLHSFAFIHIPPLYVFSDFLECRLNHCLCKNARIVEVNVAPQISVHGHVSHMECRVREEVSGVWVETNVHFVVRIVHIHVMGVWSIHVTEHKLKRWDVFESSLAFENHAPEFSWELWKH